MTIIPCLCGGTSAESSLLYLVPYKFCFTGCNEHIWPVPGTHEFAAAIALAKAKSGRVINISAGETLRVSIGPGDNFASAIQAGLSSLAIAKAQRMHADDGSMASKKMGSEENKQEGRKEEKSIKVERERHGMSLRSRTDYEVSPKKGEKKMKEEAGPVEISGHAMVLRARIKKESD